MVVFGQSGSIRTKEVEFGRKRFFLGKSGCILVRWLYSGKSESIRAKMVLFGQKWLY